TSMYLLLSFTFVARCFVAFPPPPFSGPFVLCSRPAGPFPSLLWFLFCLPLSYAPCSRLRFSLSSRFFLLPAFLSFFLFFCSFVPIPRPLFRCLSPPPIFGPVCALLPPSGNVSLIALDSFLAPFVACALLAAPFLAFVSRTPHTRVPVLFPIFLVLRHCDTC